MSFNKNNDLIGATLALAFSIVIFSFLINTDLSKAIFGEIKQEEQTQETKTFEPNQPNEAKPINQEQEIKENDDISKNEIYRYEREDGIIVMVNDINKVPNQYRPKMKILEESKHELTETPIKVINNNRMIVKTTINYNGRSETIDLLIDTGATGINISRDTAYRLGINPEAGRPGTVTFADGRKAPTSFIKTDSIKVGPKTLLNPEIQIIQANREEDEGLLGMEFLKEFPHTFDLKNQKIKWL